MGVGAIGASGVSFFAGSFSSASDTREGIEKKLSDLKQQRKEFEQFSDSDKMVQSIDKRINNLQSRLDKMDSKGIQGKEECKTCENRRYQDGSDDPGVSFKTASKVKPEEAEAAVRGHEMEHVNRNRAKASREGKEVVYQNVTIKRGICPECGDTFVAGGETVTATRNKQEQQPKQDQRFKVGLTDYAQAIGGHLNSVA
ncbi:MAG: hypothetical protein IJ446_04615 [Oscillospiraceae bacterium]|nr:hypothetical protein [Oscillospiraceae bacterium]